MYSTYFFLLNLGRGSPSTTDSKKSWGVMYIWPSYSTEANFMKRFSRGVSLRFSVISFPLLCINAYWIIGIDNIHISKSMEIKISNRNNLPWRKGWLRVGKRKQNSFFLGLRYQIQYWCASNTTNKCKQNETFWSNILESRWWGRWSRPYYTYNLKVFEIRSWDCQCFLI